MNEMSALQALRAEVPEPSAAEVYRDEARFVAAVRAQTTVHRRHRPVRRFAWRVGLAGGLAAGLAAVAAVGVLTTRGADGPEARPHAVGPGVTASAEPKLRPVSAAQVLDLAATAAEAGGEINPRADQFLVYESITMYTADSFGDNGRYLYRTKRTFWQSADGSRTGALRVEYLEPRAYPGSSLPPQARTEVGRTTLHPMCSRQGPDRRDYGHLRTLPTDPEQLLAYVARRASGKGDRNYLLWKAAGELFRESYLPPAQRAALYRAIKTIPGVQLVEQAEDAAGRVGVGVGFVDTERGVRAEMIFDAGTFRYLGERAFVIDAAKAQAPVGSQVAGTAELSVTVADSAPAAPAGPKGADCG